jgi:hypothetical protein
MHLVRERIMLGWFHLMTAGAAEVSTEPVETDCLLVAQPAQSLYILPRS